MWSRYLALGDSITEGVGDDVGEVKCRSWADWMVDGLRETMPNLAYRNIAAAGATAEDVLRTQTKEIDAFRPDLVSVTIGANDARVPEWTAGVFRPQYSSILSMASGVGARLITGTYPDIEATIKQAGGEIRDSWRLYFQRMHEVNEVIRSVSAEFGACLIETDSVGATGPQYLSRDFTHPNALAYRLMGRYALEALVSCE